MKFIYKSFAFLVILKFCVASFHNCTSFENAEHGFGCELSNLMPDNEVVEINVLTSDETNVTKDEITWIQIRDSQLDKLPEKIFEGYVNVEKILIINSIGFARLDTPYFDRKISTIFFSGTDLEVIGKKAFSELSFVKLLSLNSNKIKEIDKSAFTDMESLERIELNSNKIQKLDDDIFAANVNLKVILLSKNQLTVINAKLYSRNSNLETIDLKSNLISQIEKDFYRNLKLLTFADFSSNVCVDLKIIVTKRYGWPYFAKNLKECNKNYDLLKPMNDAIEEIQKKMEELEGRIDEVQEKVSNDMKILEGKMENSTAMEEIKTDLVNFFVKDKEQIKKNFKQQLEDISSDVKDEMKRKIESEVERKLGENQEKMQEKLVTNNYEEIRREFSGKITLLYFIVFAGIGILLVINVFIMRRFKFFPRLRYHGNNAELLGSEI